MRLITPIIDTLIIAAVIAWSGALLWWLRHGLHGFTDALVAFGLLFVSFIFLVCVFSK